MDERFRTQSGFIGRGGIAQGLLDQWYTYYLKPGRFLESIDFDPALYYTWTYSALVHQGEAMEKKWHNRIAVTARGGWSADATLMTETFGFDPALYARYRVLRGPADTAAFTGSPRIGNRDFGFSLNTPQWKHVSLSAFYLWGSDENFLEWAPADIIFANFNAEVRPTDRLRITRATSSSASSVRPITRRWPTSASRGSSSSIRSRGRSSCALVGEYASSEQDACATTAVRTAPARERCTEPGFTDGTFRSDFLLSYRPIPGTVFFMGYGAGYADTRDDPRSFTIPRSLAPAGLSLTDNVFYVKASYLYRL